MLSQLKFAQSGETWTLEAATTNSFIKTFKIAKSQLLKPSDIFTVGLSFETCLSNYQTAKESFQRLLIHDSTTSITGVVSGGISSGTIFYNKTGFKNAIRDTVTAYSDSEYYCITTIMNAYKYTRHSSKDVLVEDYNQTFTNCDLATFNDENYVEVDRNTGLIVSIDNDKPAYSAQNFIFHYKWVFINNNKTANLAVTSPANSAVLTITINGQSDYLKFSDNLEGNTAFAPDIFHTSSASTSSSFTGAITQNTDEYRDMIFTFADDYSQAQYEDKVIYSRI